MEQTPEDLEQKVIARIAECQKVIQEVDGSEGWQIIGKDIERYLEDIDSRWHLAPAEKLGELRTTKFAIEHIKNLVSGYRQDLEAAKLELDRIQNPDATMEKDFDTESFNEV